MPSLPRVNLSISLTTNDACTGMSLADTTSDYGQGGNAGVNDVAFSIITVNLPGGSYFTYNFTIASGIITAATLSVGGSTPTNILALLITDVWPFTAFNLWGSYGVVLPTFSDGVIKVDYTISNPDPSFHFSYTTSETVLIDCAVCQCITEMGQKMDPKCACEDNSMWDFLRASTYLEVAQMQVNIGNSIRAQLSLDKATNLCKCSCGC